MLTHLSVGCTNLLHRALCTARVIAGADSCAEIHESLVPVIGFVGRQDALGKREHLGVDEVTDVLSFPIDAREHMEPGVPRQLGDAILCPQVTGDRWQGPLAHGLLHLLGYDHGSEMKRREARWTE